jgi:hypothetical protein
MKRLTVAWISSELKEDRTEDFHLYDGSCPGLSLRIHPSGTASWSLVFRVVGEGGINKHGKALLGKRYRANLGSYPIVTLEAARAKAFAYLEQARRRHKPEERAGGECNGRHDDHGGALGGFHE